MDEFLKNKPEDDEGDSSVLNPAKKGKKSFETSERMTLRIDAQQAEQYLAQKGKIKIGQLSPAMKNMSKKVRDSRDDEDEYDSMDLEAIQALQQLRESMTDASNGDNTLINALSPNERQMLNQRSTIEVTRREENAGKLNALLQADSLSHRAGLSELSRGDFANQMQEAIYNPRRTRMEALEKNIANRVGIVGKITKRDTENVVDGVKQIRETTNNHQVKKVSMNDAATIGKKKMSKNETAELILRKSGQTARLAEIKKETAISKTKKKEPKKSYDAEMKKLLQASLGKKDKVH